MPLKPQANEKQRKIHYTLLWAALLTGLLCGVTVGAFLALTRDLPQINALESFKPSAITRVFSADQVLLAELYVEHREPVPFSQIPEMLKAALLTTEDRQFYEHSGIDIRGILRASVKNVLRGRLSEGASTLTQQLAKTLFLTPEKSFARKLREAILALQLERRYTKDEILALYLNQVYFGSGAYGAAMAARTYFNKPLQELTLAECALIAGLPQSPSRYSPLVSPALALKRRNNVLAQMHATGVIDTAAYQRALDEPLFPSQRPVRDQKAPYFISFIKEALEEAMGENLIYKGGLTVFTTLNQRAQIAAEQAVDDGLAQLEVRMQQNGFGQPHPQAALMAMDVNTGAIVSMVGGREETPNAYNRATVARRQPGSAFKPIVYALAVERGYNQNQTLMDVPVVFPNSSEDKDWQPENSSQTYDGEISIRWALAQSKNIPAVRLIDTLGPSAVVQFAQNLGITSSLNANLSLALGTSEVTLMELTAAYAAFANYGEYIKPYGIAEVRDDEGQIVWSAKPERHVALARASAAIVTDMLEAAIQEGTGWRARRLRDTLAGKTGTTNQFKDALFIGYSPVMAAGVWVGNDDGSTLGPQETGARAALPIWMAFMQKTRGDQPQSYFDIPDGVHSIYMDSKTGAPRSAEGDGAVKALVK
ncbi:MAG: PBP1A family penicillin-binding protein [Desulfobacteraceae bacterium]|nr:PBP1A family penicillin-binding protein [Desulfobacteraceae bacterium]